MDNEKTSQKQPRKQAKTTTKKSREPFVCAFFGKPHSGKTYNVEKWAKKTKQTVLVYNFGREEDFADYEIIQLVENPKGEVLFEYQTKIYSFEKNFKTLFEGKRVKCLAADNVKDQENFFKTISRSSKLQNIVLIIDDFTQICSEKLTQGVLVLLAKSKHNKVDVVLISHLMDVFPRRAFGFLTHIKMFKTLCPPTNERLKYVPNPSNVIRAWHRLEQLPPYSFIYFELLTGKVQEYEAK